MSAKILKNKTVNIQNRDQQDALFGSPRALDAITSLTPTDQNIEVITDSLNGGSRVNIGDSKQTDCTAEVPIAGSGQIGIEPPFAELHKACAQIVENTKILTINNINGSGFIVGETLQNTTTPGDVGRVFTSIPLNKIDGALAVDGVNTLGSATLNVDLTANAKWDTDIFALLVKGTAFTIAGDVTVYETTADVEWTEASSIATIPITPNLVSATVGAEAITLTGLYKVAIFSLDTAPAITDDLLGATSTTTAKVYEIEDAFLYYENLSNQYSVDIELNVDGYLTVAQRGKGTGEFTYALGANGSVSYTINGAYIKPTDSVLVPNSLACLLISPCVSARFIFDGYDFRHHQVNSVSFNLNATVSADSSQTSGNTIRRFDVTDISPTAAFTVGKLDVADFDSHLRRDNNETFVITYEHNPNGTEQTRLIHVIPRGQFSGRPGTGDLEGKVSDELAINCTIPCGVQSGFPKHGLVVY